MKNFIIAFLSLIALCSQAQKIPFSSLNVKTSIIGTEKIAVSGSGNPAITPNLLGTFLMPLTISETKTINGIGNVNIGGVNTGEGLNGSFNVNTKGGIDIKTAKSDGVIINSLSFSLDTTALSESVGQSSAVAKGSNNISVSSLVQGDGLGNYNSAIALSANTASNGSSISIVADDVTANTNITINGAAGTVLCDANGVSLSGFSTKGVFVNSGQIGGKVFQITTAATNDDPTVSYYQNRLATTNATITTLNSYTTATDNTIFVKGTVIARRTGGSSGSTGDAAAYDFIAMYKNVAGTVTAVGTPTITVVGESQAAWDCTLDVASTAIRVRVTGAANNNITWHLSEFKIMSINQ